MGNNPFNPIATTHDYEMHITFKGTIDTRSADHVEALGDGWKFSMIEGDPDLGDGVRCYATKHTQNMYGPEHLREELARAAGFLHGRGCKILREKIEMIVHDYRHTKRLSGYGQ